MTVDELVEELKKQQKKGNGQYALRFDSWYDISGVKEDANDSQQVVEVY